MDIKNPNQQFNDELDNTLSGQGGEGNLLDEEKELVELADKIKGSAPVAEPNKQFTLNLRKRLVNEHEHLIKDPAADKPASLLKRGRAGLLPKPRRRFVWAAVPIAVVALLLVFSSIAMASPGFYEKFVPQPVKSALEKAAVVKTGSLKVTSVPEGASVYLNGRDYGETPVEIANIRTGEHNLEISKDGYETIPKKVLIEADQTSELDFVLTLTAVVTETNPEEIPEEIVETSNKQLVFLTGGDHEASLALTGIDELGIIDLATFYEDISKMSMASDGTVYYVYETDDGQALMRLLTSGVQEALVDVSGVTDLQATPNGKYAVYTAATEDGWKLNLVAAAEKKDSVLAAGDGAVTLVAVSDDTVYFTEGSASVTVLKTVDIASGNISEITLPEATEVQSLQVSPAFNKIMYANSVGEISIFDIASGVILDSGITTTGVTAWVGNEKVAIGTMEYVKLLDLNSQESVSIYKGTSENLMGGSSGKTVGIVISPNELVTYYIGSEQQSSVRTAQPIEALLGWLPVGFWTPGTREYLPETIGAEEIDFVGQLDLPQAAYEDLVSAENYAYRVSNGKNSLEVISITDMSNPEVVANLPVVGFDREIQADISGARIVAVGGPMVIYDVSNPEDPKIAYNGGSGYTNVALGGNTAFVAASNMLSAYDISGNAVPLGEIELPVEVYDMEYRNGKVYVAGGDGGYIVINAADPEHMELASNGSKKFIGEIASSEKFSFVQAGAPGGTGELEVYDIATGELAQTITPAISGGEFEVVGSRLYSHFPKVAIYEILSDGEVILLKEAAKDDIIKMTGDMGVVGSTIAVLSQNTLFVFNESK